MNFRPWLIIYYLVPLFLLVLPQEIYSQAFFISVNALDDTDDGQCSTNHCSFREALNLANGFQGQMTIGFSLPNTGENRIEITSELPAITNFGALTVDGSTQPNGAKVVIDGNDRANFGLELESASNTSVLGLSFENFRTAGVYVSPPSINCIIGTENSGNIFEGNRNGVVIQGANADIRNNQFIRNDILGILVTGSGASATIGSFGNPAADNIFNGQGISGIETDVSADFTNIIRNQFLCNERQGINNFNNGNNGIDPPVILSAEPSKITGTADRSALVQVYAFNPNGACFGDNPCQGNTFLGATFADTQGNWELSGGDLEVVPDVSNLVTATQIEFDRFNNTLRYTSEFSDCASLCPIYTLRLEFKSPECLGDTFTIFVLESVTGGDTSEPLNYLWTTPSGLTSTQKDLRTTEVGIFTLLASNSCNSIEEKIEIQALEILPESIDVSYNGPICEFDTLQLFSETIQELEYEWTGPFSWSDNIPNPIVNSGASALRSGQYFLNTKGIQFGCPGPKDTVNVFVKRPPEIDSTSFIACVDANEKTAIFNLIAKDTVLAGPDTSLRVLWFEDPLLQSPITFPAAYVSSEGNVFAIIEDSLACFSDTARIPLILAPGFELELTVLSTPDCANPTGGTIRSLTTGGTAPFSFLWFETGSTQAGIGNLGPGVYTLQVSDANGCTKIDSVRIPDIPEIEIQCQNIQPVSTVGGADGVSIVNFINTVNLPAKIIYRGPITDSLFASGNTSDTLRNLPAGDYTLEVQAADGCIAFCSFSVFEPDCSNFFLSFSQINPSCGATNDGSIALQVSGLNPIQYVWSNAQFNNLSAIGNLEGGVYEVTVTDAAGCSDRASITLIQAEPELISCLGNPVSSAGAQDGSAEINAGGGTAPYQLSWTGPTNGNQRISQAGETLIENLAVGTYSFTLTDAIGCSDTCSVDILDIDCSNFNLQLSPTNSTCADSNDGRIEPLISGGTETLIFNWSNGSNLANIQGLSPGSYTLTLSDNLGCRLVKTAVIQAPPSLTLDCSDPRNTSILGGNDGQISLDISGGNAPYSISIPALGDSTFSSETAAMLTLSNLSAGDYEVLVRDLNDCLARCSFSIEDPDCSTFSILSDIIQPLCPEEATGSIRIIPQNGSGPFIYDWALDSLDGQSTIMELSPGNYAISVSDQRACSVEDTFEIAAINGLPSVLLGPNATLCFNDCYPLSVVFSGEAPFRLEYQISDGFNSVDFILNSNQADTLIEICASSFTENTNLITLNFTALSDATCSTPLNSNRVINLLNNARSLLDTLLCTGSLLNINGTTYDQDRPRGIEILTGAASNGCDSLIEIDLRFVDPPEPLGIQSTCDINTNQFSVSFQALGLAPFRVEGISGQFNSNIFTSAPLPANGIYNITLFDQLGCSNNFEISAPNCSREVNCSQFAGSLAPFPSSICELELLNLNTNGDEQLDSNSILLFALHNGTQNTLGEILLSNSDGVFSYQLPLQAGVRYSTAILVGQHNGFGGLNFSDPCLDIFLGPGFQYNFTPDRPLYIQGQDTLCVGETLTLSTESYNNPGIQYEWVSPLNDTLITDTNSIQFVNVGPELDGSFSVRVRDGQCVSPFFSPHQFKSIAFPFLFAGEDQTICSTNQAALQADPISFGDGIWTSPGQAIIISPASDSTLVRNLEPGPNIFIWSVSANDCERADTVILTYTPTPVLGDDNLALEPGLTRITFDPFLNDQVDGLRLDNSTVQIVNQPESGMVGFLSNDLVFEYTADLSNLEAISFEYTVCAPACSTGCDTALVIINLPDVILDVPDGIIRGRSENGLQIGNLEAFPDNEIIISNRWGVVVYQERNYSNNTPWLGTHNGSDLPQGTYYMYLKIEGKRSIVRKTIHLIVR